MGSRGFRVNDVQRKNKSEQKFTLLQQDADDEIESEYSTFPADGAS